MIWDVGSLGLVMMNVNKYRCLLNLYHILGCKKIVLPSAHKERLTASHAGFATSFLKRAKQKHFTSNKNVKKDLQEGKGFFLDILYR